MSVMLIRFQLKLKLLNNTPYKFPQYQNSKTSFWQFLCCYMHAVGQNHVSTLVQELDAW